VAHGGSGTTCSQSAPCGTIAAGIAKLQAGATLYIRGGTSASDPNAIWDARVSWGISGPKGTPSAPITVSAYPGDTVIMKPSTSGSYVRVFSAYGAAGVS
jgi:hypothetical protein